MIGTHRRQEQRRYRALARMGACSVSLSDEDLVADRVSASAAGPALAAGLPGLDSGDRDVLLLVAVPSGTTMIASHGKGEVIGVQTPTTFTPLPPGVQHYFRTGQPAW